MCLKSLSRLGPFRSQYEFFDLFFFLGFCHVRVFSASASRTISRTRPSQRNNNDNSNGSRDSRMHIRLHHSIMGAQITVNCVSMIIMMTDAARIATMSEKPSTTNPIFDLNSTEIRRKSVERKFQMKLNTISRRCRARLITELC